MTTDKHEIDRIAEALIFPKVEIWERDAKFMASLEMPIADSTRSTVSLAWTSGYETELEAKDALLAKLRAIVCPEPEPQAQSVEADGYVAWHPEKGVIPFNHQGKFIGDDFNAAMEELKEDYALINDFESETEPDGLQVMTNVSFVKWLHDKGWKIRPVKLLFLDEGKCKKE